MKVLLIVNNQKWKTWNSKIQTLKDWFKPAVDLEFTLSHVDFKKIPFVPVDNGKEIDPKWYNENILPLAGGYDVVMFSVPLKQWKGEKIRGRWTRGDIQKIQLGADESGTYEYNKIKHEGGRWFNIARHELCHAISAILKIQDRTHYWWELGNLEQILNEFKVKKTPPIVLIERNTKTKNQTTGNLTAINEGATFTCKTLELADKNNQQNISCIPSGVYKVVWSFSPRFMKFTYEITGVKNRSGIRVHSGNFFTQINGCILLGNNLVDINGDKELDVINSQKTIELFNNFMGKKEFTLIIK